MDIPNKDTFEILEERKKYLLIKNQKSNNKNGYINAEIGALDRITNFAKLFLDNFPSEFLEKMITEYELNKITITKNRKMKKNMKLYIRMKAK